MSGNLTVQRSGIVFPKETIRKLDERKGYYSRNRYMLKIIEEYLNREDKENIEEVASVANTIEKAE